MRHHFPRADVESVKHGILNFIIFIHFGMIPRVTRADVAYSVQRLATGWTAEGPEFESR
jgi:hypothetical protein